MRSRNLHVIHDLIVSNYQVTPLPSGKFLHQFTPKTSDRIYEFESNSTPILENGERYNVGFTPTADGRLIVDPSALGKVGSVNKILSYLASRQFSGDILAVNTKKNNDRVSHGATDGGYYWGKKYAWRRYGLVIAEGAFLKYLDHIGHQSVPCRTADPDRGYVSDSTAYLDDGIEQAMEALIETAVPDEAGRYHKSPLYPSRFQIKAIDAISDKK